MRHLALDRAGGGLRFVYSPASTARAWMMPDTESQSANRPRINRSIVLLAVYAVLLGWLFYLQATSWPHEGSWAFLGYIFLVPGVVFQTVSLAYAKIAGRPLARRALTRVVTIPIGLVLAGR